jgi:hypothetical protein
MLCGTVVERVDLGRLLLERDRDDLALAADTTEEQARQPAELSNARKAEPESNGRIQGRCLTS